MDFTPKYKGRFKGINEQEKMPVFEDVIGYKSPITVIYGEMKTEQENEVLRVVQHYGIDVDKEELIKALKYDREQYSKGYVDGIKKFAEEITEIFIRYAHLHNYAEKSRTETIESAEGEKIEMQSVWDVLSLKKYEMAEYEEMSELQKNIEIIAKERLLTELEKDFRLLVKEMVGDEK